MNCEKCKGAMCRYNGGFFCYPCQTFVPTPGTRLQPSYRTAVSETPEKPKVAVRGTREAQGAGVAGGVRWLNLPYPPSTNNLFATVRGRRIKSAAGRAYHTDAGMLARVAFPEPMAGRLTVGIVISPKRGVGMDLDNACKATLDALTGVVWGDDCQIWRLTIERAAPVAGGALVVSVEEYREEITA